MMSEAGAQALAATEQSLRRLRLALADGSAEEREAAYCTIEQAVRGVAYGAGSSRDDRAAVVRGVVGCARPLIASVLCAPASRVSATEFIRASLLLFELHKLGDLFAVTVEVWRPDENGVPLAAAMFNATETALAAVHAKDPSNITRDDAILAALSQVPFGPLIAVGISGVLQAAGMPESAFRVVMMANPYAEHQSRDRNLPLALACIELVREDDLPEAVKCGALFLVCCMLRFSPSHAQAVWEAGGLDVIAASLLAYNPIEQISRQALVPSAAWGALKDLTESCSAAGIDVIQPLLQAGVVDAAVSAVTAYQMLNNPNEASPCSVCYGALQTLESLLATSQEHLVAAKLRSVGVDAVRYLIDNPLVVMKESGIETGVQATRIAALVWGRDDDGGGLTFNQHDIDVLVEFSSHRHRFTRRRPMHARWGSALLSLSVSDINKALLLKADGIISLLQDSLLLDPEHPRRNDGKTNFEAVCGPVQRDYTEAIAQLAMFPPGREALLQDPTMVEALRRVASEGWEEESRRHAQAALVALFEHQPDHDHLDVQGRERRHVMLSYQWRDQPTVKRINEDLLRRGFLTWFDLTNMKGSTADAMADAVDNAEVMLSCICPAYKESPNCRLECQYGHQQDLDMVPLMMIKDYRPTGWLGLIVGTKLYFNFFREAVETDATFNQQMDAVARELGERGKSHMLPSAPHPEPTVVPAPTPAPMMQPVTPTIDQTADMLTLGQSICDGSTIGCNPTDFATFIEKQQRLQMQREEKLEAKLEQFAQQMQAAADAKLEQVEQQKQVMLAQVEYMRLEQQLPALQTRLETLHDAKLLTDEELFSIEDVIADLDVKSENVRVGHLITLSQRMVGDAAFSRQLRRKILQGQQ